MIAVFLHNGAEWRLKQKPRNYDESDVWDLESRRVKEEKLKDRKK
jgi:hypothetical protein